MGPLLCGVGEVDETRCGEKAQASREPDRKATRRGRGIDMAGKLYAEGENGRPVVVVVWSRRRVG